MNEEIWKKVIENSRSEYYVSNLGNCKRVIKHTGQTTISKGQINERIGGYVQFANDYVHRLVAKAFIPNPLNLEQVDHINNNRQDNRVENLRWVSRKENNSTEHAKLMRKQNKKCTSHKGMHIKATNGDEVKYFKNGYQCAACLKCSHVLVYNALNGRLAATTAKGWKLSYVKTPQTKEQK